MEKENAVFSLYPSNEIERTFNFNDYPLKDIHLISTKNVENYSATDRNFPQHYLCEYILNGSGSLIIDGKTIPFTNNSTIFIRKGTDFSIIADNNTTLDKIDIVRIVKQGQSERAFQFLCDFCHIFK